MNLDCDADGEAIPDVIPISLTAGETAFPLSLSNKPGGFPPTLKNRMSEQPLRIISLTSENVKRLKAVTITPTGDLVVIGGNNSQGKSSLLDSIAMALGGKNEICQKPLRDGEKRGFTTLDLGEFVVERTYTEAGGGTLTVKNRDGAKYSSPQALLDKLTGSLTFDPLAFSRLKPKDQLETLRQLVGVDTSEIDSARQVAFDQRTEVNRDAKRAEAERDRLLTAVAGQDEPKDEPDLSALTEELEAAKATNAGNQSVRNRLAQVQRNVNEMERQLAEAKAHLTERQDKLADMEGQLERGKAVVASLVDENESEIVERIRGFEALSKVKRDFTALASARRSLSETLTKADSFTAEIERLDEQKRAAIAGASYPIPGMTLGEDGILLDGLPFSQASSAQQLRVSVAMGLALNPRLKVLLIRDGSLLDAASLKMVAAIAHDNGAQVWIERVGHGAECSVIIEDGSILETR